jgi:hypothetical protein
VQVLAAQYEQATILLDEALQTARCIADNYQRGTALSRVARALALAGETGQALQTARAITDEYRQTEALSSMTEALVRAGQPEQALQAPLTRCCAREPQCSWENCNTGQRRQMSRSKRIAHR